MFELNLVSEDKNTLGKPAIVLRDLWRGLELARQYGNWVAEQLDLYSEGIDFVRINLNVNPTNGVAIQDHAVSLESERVRLRF